MFLFRAKSPLVISTALRIAVCCAGLGLFVCAPALSVAKAQEKPAEVPESKDKSKIEALKEELDKLEAEMDEAIRLANSRKKPIRDVALEFENEFVTNKALIEERLAESPNADVAKLQNRQQLISMYLWQMQRVGASLIPRMSYSDSPMARVSGLYRTHREALKDRALMARVTGLMRRSSELVRQQSSSSSASQFYFVVPKDPVDPKDSGKQEKAAAKDDPFGVAGPFGGDPFARPNVNPVETKEGLFRQYALELNQLMKLTWIDGRLMLDRDHWSKPLLGKTLADLKKEVDEVLEGKGVDPTPDPKANRVVVRPFAERPDVVLLLENFQHVVGARRTSTTSGTKNWKKRFSNGLLECSLNSTEIEFDFTIEELSGSRRMLRVTSRTLKDLRITLMSDDRVMVFMQKINGGVSFVDTAVDGSIALHAKSFVDLYREHPTEIDERLFGLLGELSILLPPSRLQKPFVDRLAKSVTKLDPAFEQEFRELMEKVDGGKFAIRAKATKTLIDEFERFLPLLLKVENQGTLPFEAKQRLKKILEQYSAEDRGVDVMIRELNLANDVDYLIQAIGVAQGEQRESIAAQLASITKQQFGSDVDAWKSWHEKK